MYIVFLVDESLKFDKSYIFYVSDYYQMLQGTKISGYVKRALLTNFRKMLKEGDTVEISDFGVDDNPATKWHKARVNHPVKVLFNYITKVSRSKPDFCIPSNGLNLVPFDDIPCWKSEFFIGMLSFYAIKLNT